MNRLDLDTWILRDQLLALVRRWYLGAAALVAGALVGLVLVYLLPPRYEARLAFYVAFNADAQFLTPDDYKNWQMEELEGFVHSDALLQETALKLREQDPSRQTGIETLRRSLAPRWRNAGTWHLTSTSDDPDWAAAMLDAWSQEVFARTTEALAHAETFNLLDTELALQQRALGDIQAEAASLEALQTAVRDFSDSLEFGASLAGGQHAQAAALANRLHTLYPHQTTPNVPDGDDPADYLAWAQEMLAGLAAQRQVVDETRLTALADIAELGERWSVEKAASHGLSAYLLVERQEEASIEVLPLRAAGAWMLSGSLVGLFGWLLLHFGRAVRFKRGDK